MAIGHRGAREKGGGIEEAALDAGIVRLRPVLITVGATIFALVPLALHGRPLWESPGILSISVLDLKIIKWEPGKH